jgi:alkanesulfonate monooxygenase SsuD/methylene tetrahydromethanopterin reductase-like flavin-dependent oxidoreductase (luciferase family)
MVATLDNLADGRVVLGLGAGWQQNEHDAYGIEYGTVSSRLDMLEEACQVLRGLFQNDYFNFDGQHYQLKNAPLEPKPQQAKIPLMIGGGGEQRTLKIAAQYADEWNVWGDAQILRHKMNILDQHCESAGRDPHEIERSAVALLFLSDNEKYLNKIRAAELASPAIIGNVNEVIEIVSTFKEIGVKELIIPDFTLGTLIGADTVKQDLMEKFITEVAAKIS